MTGIHTAK